MTDVILSKERHDYLVERDRVLSVLEAEGVIYPRTGDLIERAKAHPILEEDSATH